MAIPNIWQDIGLDRFASLTSMPSMPKVAINVARRLNTNRLVPVSRTARVPYSQQMGLANPYITQQENIMSVGNGLARAWDFAQKWEGGYSNDPDDRGGETRYGIAKNFNPDVDVKNITREKAMNIFRDNYYNPSGAERMSPALGLYLADAAFNQGLGGMRSIMQNAIGTTDIDKMNAMDQKNVLEAVHNARIARYKNTPGWSKFGKGWINRANDAYQTALELLGV